MNPGRRAALRAIATSGTVALLAGAPAVVRSQAPLSLGFRIIPDPDGWHTSLRLKGDWLVFEISDGVHSGFGEASHSRDDAACRRRAGELFADFYTGFSLSMESLRAKEAEIATLEPDFVTATAFSGINQALYDLLAKREQVPVWQLFTDRTSLESVPLYTTINRALAERTHEEYLELVEALIEQGFQTFKCAPFEQVDRVENAIAKSRAGLETLAILRDAFSDARMRVDFHERFRPRDFYELLPELEVLGLDWIEEPFSMGPDYTELRARTNLTVAGGELFWGGRRFGEIADNAWVDVIMPDVKHVGGFGPLLRVFELAEGRVSVSPHNPSGPISTAASLHAAALFPERVDAIEYAFDRAGSRSGTGERVSRGRLYLPNRPGWGVAPA
jgi:galactonate dehydratase